MVLQPSAKFRRYMTADERQWSTIILCLVIPLPIFLLGFTIAFPSSATLDLTGEATELPSDFLLSTSLISLFVALGPLGAIFGGPFAGWIADRWGRKCCMMFCGIPYLIGYLLLSYAHYASTATSFKVLLLTGRFVCGVGFGWASAVVPVYLGEVSSKRLRGVVGATTEAMVTCGIVFSYALGAIRDFRYYSISLVAVGIVALYEVLMFWLPETPRWLLARGRVKQAESVLLWLRGKKIDIKSEVEEIKKVVVAKKKRKKNILREFSRRSVFIPFIYVLTIFILQQTSGISAIAAFAATIFSDAGVSSPRATSIYAVGVASLVGNVSTFFLVDIVGRATLLILSSTGMFLGSSMLGIHFFITRPSLCSSSGFKNSTISLIHDVMNDPTVPEPCNAHFGPLAIVSLILYRFSFSIGLGSIPWILVSELLPLSVRGFASGLVTIMTWTVSSAVTGLYLEYVALVQQWGAMWTFALFNLVAILFVIIFIPETKGKSLEELERKFSKTPVVETVL